MYPKGYRRSELLSVAMLSDDLRLEATCQTNLEIAGSPRNIFGYSAYVDGLWGRALNGCRLRKRSSPIKLRIHRYHA